MTQRTCSIDDCDRPHRARGYCAAHYNATMYGPDRHRRTLACAQCGCEYSTTRWNGRYCSLECRDAAARPAREAARAERERARRDTKPPVVDRRSALRRAVEEGDSTATLAAIRDGCKLTAEGCWEWQRRRDRSGYAATRIGRQDHFVHRLSLQARLGRPLGSQPVHHICANVACVNPDHLQAITHRENVAEMLARNYLVRRIGELEAALTLLDPDHPLLGEVGVPSRP